MKGEHMDKIKFSEHEMAFSWELGKIVEKINDNTIESEWSITDLLDFYNILKYMQVTSFSDQIVQETSINVKTYVVQIKQKIGRFVNGQKGGFISLYDEIDFDDTSDFFEVIDNYKLYENIEITSFREFLNKENVHINSILEFKRLTDLFDEAVKDVLLLDPMNAETILSKYLKEVKINLPPSLTNTDVLSLIDKYIGLPVVNLNVLRTIINFPTNKGLSITDKIKLHAKRRAEEEEAKIFHNSVGIESGVMIAYPKDQVEPIVSTIEGRTTIIKVSRKWIEENNDYATLWNNFIYLFGFVDEHMRLELDSKKSESSALESAFRTQAEHLYYQSSSFNFKEMLSYAELYSFVFELNEIGIRLEEMIKWFFEDYLRLEFQIENFKVKMPSNESSYFEKCRTILPEIDRIFKQYNILLEEGGIDQELIQMSSSSFKIKDIKSLNKKKYVYTSSDWYKTASFFLFSDQSSIFYLPNKKEKYKNFYNLITSEMVTKDDFHEYQWKTMQWLFDNNLINENNTGKIQFVDNRIIYILKELYYKEVISYWRSAEPIQILIDELNSQNLVNFESSLFSRNEQDYLDYYLNKSKFTNGHDIRNKYLHGTNIDDEKQYETDYYLILKLFVIIIIKINDDLCINEDRRK
ncbi:hypothetical protein [Niallia sp. BSM11]|uniref:hypothetical protein n=1 Tax=Niallia sp. BSM11 TaxID=3391576 RepID=UPI003984B359